jgi:hypothetical protein
LGGARGRRNQSLQAKIARTLGHLSALNDATWEHYLEAEHCLEAGAKTLHSDEPKKGDLSSIYRGIGLMQESTAYDEIMEEGEIKRSHRLLLLQGRERLSAPDAEVEGELTAIRDLDRLDRLIDAVLTANSWQELLATP